LETAHAGFILLGGSLDSDVAFLTPSRSPRILDDPVVSGTEGSFFGSHTYKENTVIKRVTAEMLDNSTMVHLESKSGSVNRN